MKTGFFLNVFIVALIAAVLSACIGGAPPVAAQAVSNPDQLDAAIREASNYLSGRVPEGSKVAFLNIKSDYPDLSEYLLSILSENAVNDGVFSVVDRQQLDIIRTELNFQMSGEVSDESAQSIGQMLGAQSIVSGAVNRIGPLYRMQVKAIEVQTAGVQAQWSRSIPRGATIAALTENYAPAGAGTAAASTPAAGPARSATPSPAAPAPEPPAYRIGDEGPAGGLVFYDKGNNSEGWRYMEAAPASTELKDIKWGPNGVVDGTRIEIGAGKRNTRLIVNHAITTGGNYRAAWLCDSLEYGGYDDWFLPSKAELNLMYLNLKERDLGGFIREWYWSSSESGNNNSWTQGFGSGNQIDDPYGGWAEPYGQGRKDIGHNVRAARQF
ncbi:MAG: CsgG/HfaB family protein [Spirochaetaceae bacterium]|nr:CsgG/HfaB family protein [Spirochaetaceae bacterium]